LPLSPVLKELRRLVGVGAIGGGGEMNEGAELATAGLVVAFAAVAGRLAPFHRSPICEAAKGFNRFQNNN
jgi:hypothetical protein